MIAHSWLRHCLYECKNQAVPVANPRSNMVPHDKEKSETTSKSSTGVFTIKVI
jgi:hypothetical protein